ncbi:MAG: metallophosphoesterase [Promethearchaeota archaeon]|nr:MAG: metallophosphoesterase [Candidatus Lokiarchaeota archaeon]
MIEPNKKNLLIGVISDTHIPSRAATIPQEIIDDFKERNIDYVFHLGDFTTLDAYNQLLNIFGKEKIIGISGNMDSREINKILPESREFELLGHKIFLTHGGGGPRGIIRRLNKAFDLSPYEIIIFGHIHQPMNKKEQGKYYFNPGTPTDKRFTDINSYAFLKLSKDNIKFEIIRI